MKRFWTIIKKTPSLFALVFIGLFFFPAALASPPESLTHSIVTAIGIDKEDDQYEVTLLAFLSYPNQSYLEKYETFTSTGSTLSEAFSTAGMQIGKKISLFHTNTAIVSEKMLEGEDIAPTLDYLVRVASLPQSCLLVATNQKSKTFLDFIQKLDAKSDINLEEIGFYTSNYISWRDTTINSFLQGYYSPSKCSTINYLPLTGGDVNGIAIDEIPDEASGSGQKGGESESSAASQGVGGESGQSGTPGSSKGEKYELINDQSEMILKNGRKQKLLTNQIVHGLNWFSSKANEQLIILDDFNDANFSDAKLVYKVASKQIRQKAEFEDGYPVLLTNIRVFVSLNEINGNKNDLSNHYESNYISPEVRSRTEEFVKKQITKSLEVLKQEKSDVLNFYDKFFKSKRSQTKKFVSNLDSEEYFLENIVFKVIVNVYPS